MMTEQILNDDVKIQISKNIKFLLKDEKKTRRKVCLDLGFKYTTFCDWVNGKTTPNYRVLEQLGEYFDVEPWGFYGDIQEFKAKKARLLLAYASAFEEAGLLKNMVNPGDILKIESFENPVVVISGTEYNNSGFVMICPMSPKGDNLPQIHTVDISKANYKIERHLSSEELAELKGLIKSIIDI